MYGTVNWLNALDELGKMKKGMELLTLLFIFKSGVVLMAQERLKGKRKVKVIHNFYLFARQYILFSETFVMLETECLSSGRNRN